ncbi:MAG: DUF6644 family protein [Alphaproteobacteria bacterium]
MEDYPFLDQLLYPLFAALDASAAADYVKASQTIVPWAGVLHLIGISFLGGAVFMVDMRVLGAGITSRTPADLNRTVRPLLVFALLLTMASGSVLALGELMKLYYNPPYWLKMAALIAGLVFTFGVRDRLIDPEARGGWLTGLFALFALGFWGVAFWALSNDLARMALALLAGVLLVTLIWGWRTSPEAGKPALLVKGAAIVSIVMWLTVAASGRWIAFY